MRTYEGHLRRLEEIYKSNRNELNLMEDVESHRRIMMNNRQYRISDQQVRKREIEHENMMLERRIRDIKEGHYVNLFECRSQMWRIMI